VVVGGVIPPQDYGELREAGAAAIFGPGTVIADAAMHLVRTIAGAIGVDLGTVTDTDAHSEEGGPA
jgi:methylmalonyl-CoA mutase